MYVTHAPVSAVQDLINSMWNLKQHFLSSSHNNSASYINDILDFLWKMIIKSKILMESRYDPSSRLD